MTWKRKVQGFALAMLVFAVFLVPASDWIDGFLGGFFS